MQAQAERRMPPDLPAKKVLALFGQPRAAHVRRHRQLARALQTSGQKAKAPTVVRRGWVKVDAGEDEEKQLLWPSTAPC